MIPETSRANSIRLYEASPLPKCWKYKKTLIAGKPYSDSSIFYYALLSNNQDVGFIIFFTGTNI